MRIFSLLIIAVFLTSFLSSGFRLGEFPEPDFTKTVTLSNHGPESFSEVGHHFGKIPFHVRVYASSKDGDNAGFKFEGTGVCQNDGLKSGQYGGVMFSYNKDTIRLWAPSNRIGQVIFVGQGWGGNENSQSSWQAEVTIEAWKDGPEPSFEIEIEIDSRKEKSKELIHGLQQLPELVSVRVSRKDEATGDAYLFHAAGASQTPSSVQVYGGVLFAYNDKLVVLWTPNKGKRAGCIAVPKAWGNRKYSIPIGVRFCRIQLRLWVNSFPAPVFQSSWTTLYANKHGKSYIAIAHNLRILPSYVKVQYRINGKAHSLVFEGTGSVQSTLTSDDRYGGIVYAYDKMTVHLWLPSSARTNQAYVVFIGDGWGLPQHNISSVSAHVRVQIYADKCFSKDKVIDAQGYCRDVSETQLVQSVGDWGECSNPCGTGTKKRQVEGKRKLN